MIYDMLGPYIIYMYIGPKYTILGYVFILNIKPIYGSKIPR